MQIIKAKYKITQIEYKRKSFILNNSRNLKNGNSNWLLLPTITNDIVGITDAKVKYSKKLLRIVIANNIINCFFLLLLNKKKIFLKISKLLNELSGKIEINLNP